MGNLWKSADTFFFIFLQGSKFGFFKKLNKNTVFLNNKNFCGSVQRLGL